MPTLTEYMQMLPEFFVPEKANGVDTKVQFDFTGDDGGKYYVHIHDGVCDVHEGEVAGARTTVTAAAADYFEIVEGRLDPMKAFMTGKVKVKGDALFLMKFQQMFGRKSA
ncbi:MAG TPA: SCP2 sterol-binding domain-containing protein [Anaerolineae bacterium]|nr:SCP2 sterol-binding domain-containing protein [Anaerolineae bacterium]